MLNLIMGLKNIFSKKIIISIIITTTVWILVVFGLNFFKDKATNKKIIEATQKTKSEMCKCNCNDPCTKYQPEKIYEDGNISLYSQRTVYEKLGSYTSTISMKKKGEDQKNYTWLMNDVYDARENTGTYKTEKPNTFLIRSSANMVSGWAFIDINTKKTLNIETVFPMGEVTIKDYFNNYKTFIIKPLVDDQCNNPVVKKIWIKDLIVNDDPQNIIPKTQEIICQDGLWNPFSIYFKGINKNLDKIFFSYEIDNEVEIFFSYDLKTNKTKIEKPENILVYTNGQYIDFHSGVREGVLKKEDKTISP